MNKITITEDFTEDGSPPEEVVESTDKKEKETPDESSNVEQPTESTEENLESKPKEGDEAQVKEESEVESEEEKANTALADQKEKLLKDIVNLRKERRELRKVPTPSVVTPKESQKDDPLEDVATEDVELIEKVLKAKGYVKKGEVERATFAQTEKITVDAWLAKSENAIFRPENDPEDKYWNQLQEELKLFKAPSTPAQISKLLDRAKREIADTLPKVDTGKVSAQKQQLKNASVGSTGTASSTQKKSSAPKFKEKLTPDKKAALLRGGWSEEEIAEMGG